MLSIPYPGYQSQKIIKRKNKEGKKVSSFSFFLLPISFHLNFEALVPRVSIPVPAKVIVVVSGKNCKETGNHSFHLLLTHLHETRGTEEKVDELACFLLCFPNKQKFVSSAIP